MKKVFLILLTGVLLLTSLLALSACNKEPEDPTPAPDGTHTHEFAAEWSSSSSEHWHACKTQGCTEVSDKAAHRWNEGEITTPATEESEGVKTFTCLDCNRTKTAPADFVGNPDDLENDHFDPDEDLGEDPFVDGN